MGNAIRLHIYDDPCCSVQQFSKIKLPPCTWAYMIIPGDISHQNGGTE
jgi:hypothetical protein